MSTQAPTKTCPHCRETINAEATVCRFCGRDVRPVERLRWYDWPVMALALLFPIFGIVYGGYLALDARRRPRGCGLFLISAAAWVCAAWVFAAYA